jgi:hypothetical protein
MRLIDADALVAYIEELPADSIATTDAAALVENWPPAECRACEHWVVERLWATDPAYHTCLRACGARIPTDADFGCPYFEAKS